MLAEIDVDTAENIGLQFVQETYLGLLDVILQRTLDCSLSKKLIWDS